MKKIAIVLMSLSLLAGCASTGNSSLKDHNEDTVGSYITEGVTTKSQVMSTFGSPLDTSFTDGGREIWEYSLSDVSADAVNFIPVVNLFGSSASGTQKKLTILFDDETVTRYSMTESDVRSATGLFR